MNILTIPIFDRDVLPHMSTVLVVIIFTKTKIHQNVFDGGEKARFILDRATYKLRYFLYLHRRNSGPDGPSARTAFCVFLSFAFFVLLTTAFPFGIDYAMHLPFDISCHIHTMPTHFLRVDQCQTELLLPLRPRLRCSWPCVS